MNPENKQTANGPQESKWGVLTEYDENERIKTDEVEESTEEKTTNQEDIEKERTDIPPSVIKGIGRSALNLCDMMESDVNNPDERKKERMENESAQEYLERVLNQELITIDKLNDQIKMGNPEVALHPDPVEYNGKKITVYDLRGYPFSMISHAVDYRHQDKYKNGDNHIGVQTMDALLKDPSIWAKTEEEASKSEGYGIWSGGNAMGDTISTSYINSESNIDSRINGGIAYTIHDSGGVEVVGSYAHLCYGFSHLWPDSVIDINDHDNETPNNIGKFPTRINEEKLALFEKMKTPNDHYNEAVLRRYDKDGNPRIPDYIIAENGRITDAMKKHADYFGIPIINIVRSAYRDKEKQLVSDIVDSINNELSYEEITSTIEMIRRKRDFLGAAKFDYLEEVGAWEATSDIKNRRGLASKDDKLASKMIDIEVIELEKRLEFISDEIGRCIDEIKMANETETLYKHKSDSLNKFNIESYDATNNTWTSIIDDRINIVNLSEKVTDGVMGGRNKIDIEMGFKNGNTIKTKIYDGAHRYRAEEYYDNNPSYRELDKKGSSDEYEKIMPLVKEYISLLEENKRIVSGGKSQ